MALCTICNKNFDTIEEFRAYDCPLKNNISGKCHSTVMDRLREKSPQSTYAIIGIPESGKSYFIYSLLYTLKNPPEALNDYMERIGMHIMPTGEQALEQIKRFEEQIMVSGIPLKGMRVQDSENNVPIDINIKVGRKSSLCLTFFDLSGEHFLSVKYMLEESRVHKARGIILLMSPYDDAKLNDCLPEGQRNTRVNEVPLTDYLFQAVQDNIPRRRLQKVTTPLAICVSMFDLLKHLVPNKVVSPYIELHDMINDNDEFDFNRFKSNSRLIREFLKDNSRINIRAIEDKFSKVNYFALSAIGYNEVEKIPRKGLDPQGILAPLFWLLAETEIIPFLKEPY